MKHIVQAALERKALDTVVLDVRGRASYTDFLVVASGTSDRHVQAISEFIRAHMSRAGVLSLGSEGLQAGQWALLDFGDVVVHIFHLFTRTVYQLEAMWPDAPRIPVEDPGVPWTCTSLEAHPSAS